MEEKEIARHLSGWAGVWLALITAMWGGVVSYIRKMQKGESFRWGNAVMHLSVSGFAGVLAWLGCVQYGVSGPLTAIVTGICGHMGAEAIKMIQDRVKTTIGGVSSDGKP